MKIEGFKIPKSSFLSVEKDMNLIIDKLLANKRLLRLLKYTTKDCINQPNPSEDEELEMVGKNIKSVPKLTVDGSVLNYVIVNFDNFTPNMTNPEFRDNIIQFDIICHYDQWQLAEGQLRPYRIAAEIDSMFDGSHLTGIGTLNFIGASQMIVSDEYAGITLLYNAIHGEEDKKGFANPEHTEQFEQEFKEMWDD